eukprot:13183064-Ditylum_brightwellii.AAC.1
MKDRRHQRRKGNVWDQDESEGIGVQINTTKWMTEDRFKKICKFIPYLFADESKKEIDPWWQNMDDIAGFNKCLSQQ